ncbi:toll-interacting protein B-like protein [Leptotrombidium deliense]|uniref:Toll-interacting protein B-like protein n=1 Tax=Leptotrombidium deliense TaxID=299467 RepID=A0A443SJJ5_9ACAR|nr:toll-interacting protein B-like protein [Leptotrombidium deliense]
MNSTPTNSRRENVFVGSLPDDFLRIDGVEYSPTDANQIANDEQTALALQHQYFSGMQPVPNNIRGRLDITVTEAKLTKNYGVTRMDPYLRLRVGHHVYETKTCYNGARNPKWNKVFHCFLPNGVDSFHAEIYDECAFSTDERIAWCIYTIPERVFTGETIEDIVLLNGKQGEEKEGSLGIVTSFTPLPATSAMYSTQPVALMNPAAAVVMPQNAGVVCGSPIYVHSTPQANHVPMTNGEQHQQQQSQIVQVSDDDVKQLHEMFPSVDVDVIRTLLESNRGNKERSINALLQVTSEA